MFIDGMLSSIDVSRKIFSLELSALMHAQITMLAVTSNFGQCFVTFLRHGWAFLANRAVWHNKGKMKSYGDLFRTGDIVSVTLDLDQGFICITSLTYQRNSCICN